MPAENRRARKKLATEQTIVDTAMTLFAANSFALTTMEQIAEASDIAKATLYRYFPVKEAILVVYWKYKSEEALENSTTFFKRFTDTKSRLRAYLKLGLDEAMKNHELFSAYFNYRMQHINDPVAAKNHNSGFIRLLTRILATGVEKGELRTDIPIPVLAAQFELSASMLFVNWIRNQEDLKVNQSVSMIVDLYMRGAAAKK